jgi:hypothetical protein
MSDGRVKQLGELLWPEQRRPGTTRRTIKRRLPAPLVEIQLAGEPGTGQAKVTEHVGLPLSG